MRDLLQRRSRWEGRSGSGTKEVLIYRKKKLTVPEKEVRAKLEIDLRLSSFCMRR